MISVFALGRGGEIGTHTTPSAHGEPWVERKAGAQAGTGELNL